MKKHPYHLVPMSPWPLLASMAVLVMCVGGVLAMHGIDKIAFIVGVLFLLYTAYGWWRDIVYESRNKHDYTPVVQNGLKMGMVFFIASEVMFFVAFFWSYFYSAFNIKGAMDFSWPPAGIVTLDPMELPYLNTLILLLSGTTVTWAHYEIVRGKFSDVTKGLLITVLLGGIFSIIQAIEYSHAEFAIRDGVYSSNFYLATGFHGVHVLIGTIFLAVCLWRNYLGQFTKTRHLGLEAAAWYWHFVDVVWLFLFIAVYWYGYKATT